MILLFDWVACSRNSSLQFVDTAHFGEVITESSHHPGHETKRLPLELHSLGWKPNHPSPRAIGGRHRGHRSVELHRLCRTVRRDLLLVEVNQFLVKPHHAET